MHVVVIGAGITGLSTALTLLDESPGTAVTVVEAGVRAGGKVRTTPFAGHRVDCAADAFLARVPEGVELCRRVGLADELVSPAERTAYLYRSGALRRFPEGLVLGVPTDLDALAASGVLSPEGVARAAAELTMGPEPEARDDESVGSLVRRRLGDEVYEVLVGPLLSGVNAGSADWLSVSAGAPQLAAALREHGSLIAGARAQRAAAGAAADTPVFHGLPGGMGRLVAATAEAVTAAGGELRLHTEVTALDGVTGPDALRVATAGGEVIEADAVVLTTPLFVTAALLAPWAPEVAGAMAEVEYASATMITLAVPTAGMGRPLDASGFLVPESEGLLLTACSWASSKWAHLSSPDGAILRASTGRHHDRRSLELDDDELVEAIWADLMTTMDVSGRPTEVRVNRWPDGLPQFRPGHLGRVSAWREALEDVAPRVCATGAGFEGLGLPACIRQGRDTARRLLVQASPLPPPPGGA